MKVARCVLRGRGSGNAALLPDHVISNGGIALFNQITPVTNPQGLSWPTTRRAVQIINLLLWAGLSASPCLWPGTAPAQAIASERSATQSAQESDSLEPGKPVEREISGAQSHSYKITMSSGQYLQVAVAQRGIDVAVTLFAPDGKKIVEVNSDPLIEGSETVSVIAEAPGAYQIEARSPEKTAKTGRYEIKVEELRAATAEDKY
ncbi:MAG: PPC domain-containing protein, partial [Anaerolineales bacterium]